MVPHMMAHPVAPVPSNAKIVRGTGDFKGMPKQLRFRA
jgi:hypothetical protein